MGVIEVIEIGVVLLFIASLVGIVVKRLRMPYTVGLVVMGLALALATPFFREFSAELAPDAIRGLFVPQLILGLLVPPLIFEAASHIKLEELRHNLPLILAFAIPGVILTMLMVGAVIAWGTGLAMPVAMVFGALIAATDPVAVIALFRTLGVPKRLQSLLESESLFNDGTAIVIFSLMLSVVQTGEFSLLDGIADFLRVAGGGLIIGFVSGSIMSFIIHRIDDYLIEITLTATVAYGSYVIGESLHLSGVLAVVAAGLVIGNIGPKGMSPSTQIVLFNFWEYAAFIANSIVFLLIGLVIDLNAVIQNWQAILLAIFAVLIARPVVIYTFSRANREIPTQWQHVLYWGGLRGAISLALALSLSAEVLGEDLEVLQAMAFGVVLFTLLVQGTTMGPLVRGLKLIQRSPAEDKYERNQARAVASQAAYDRIRNMYEEGLVSDHAWQILKQPLQRQIEARTRVVHDILHEDYNVEIAELNNAYREGLRAQRSTYSTLLSTGVLSERNFSQLIAEVDSYLSREGASWGSLLLPKTEGRLPVTRLIIASMREDEAENATTTLNIMGIPSTSISSAAGVGGFSNETLLIGVEEEQEQEVLQALNDCCREKPRYERNLFERLLLPSSEKVDGEAEPAAFFVFDIEQYEEF